MHQRRLENAPIVYYVSGTEHPQWVLFLHAAFADHTMFDAQTAYFQDKYNVLTLDVIGHGASTQTRRGDSIDKMSGWIDAIIKRENIDKAHMVGVSLGAVLAQDFANRFPGSVRSLACFGGYDINNFDEALQRENGAAQRKMMCKAIFSVKWFAKSNQKISAWTPQGQAAFYRMNLRFPKSSLRYLASLGKLVNAHQTPPRRGYPLLIGCGEHTVASEKVALEQWRAHEPDCRAVVIPGAGHCVNLDAPAAFHQTLEEFWRGCQN